MTVEEIYRRQSRQFHHFNAHCAGYFLPLIVLAKARTLAARWRIQGIPLTAACAAKPAQASSHRDATAGSLARARKYPGVRRFIVVLMVLGWATLAIMSWTGVFPRASSPQLASTIFARQSDVNLTIPWDLITVVLFAPYGWSIWRFSRLRMSKRSIFCVSAVVGAVAWAALPGTHSQDIFAYLTYGRLFGVHGINPYLHLYRNDISDWFTPFAWCPQPMHYGPMVLPFFVPAAWISQWCGVLPAVFSLKLVWLLVHLYNGWLIYGMVERSKGNGARATWIYLTNPLLIQEVLMNGHCEVLIMMFSLLSLDRLQQKRFFSALLWVVFGVLVKPVGIVLLALEIAWLVRGRQWRPLLWAGASALLLVAVLLMIALPPYNEVYLLGSVAAKMVDSSLSFWCVVMLRHLTTMDDALRMTIVLEGAAIVLAALLLWSMVGVRQFRDVIRAAGWMTLASIVCSSCFAPWWVTWPLPFAALNWENDGKTSCMSLAALVFSFSVLAEYVMTDFFPNPSPIQHLSRTALTFGPLVLVIVLQCFRRQL